MQTNNNDKCKQLLLLSCIYMVAETPVSPINPEKGKYATIR
jgi:hypothetical protein